ncbi:hypothetical protein EV702DRAFT_1196166 [Suillus placidus]|uniref:Uncharacterized protein n=1 Tax=Suillus placidus TaxID=48579 RepID=A0A9P7D4C8_9AGAM|nr:hypothetical protein EV702DRAFT_1196166 [Suillus placidus]
MTSSYMLYSRDTSPAVMNLWDTVHIFEYATSRFATIQEALDKSYVPRTPHFQERFVQHLIWEGDRFVFPFINMCATNNTPPCLPEYLNQIVKMLTSWQIGVLDNPGLFQEFVTHRFDILGDLMARYRTVAIYQYGWWKDRIDLLLFEMPSRIPLDEVLELYHAHIQQTPAAHMLLPDIRRHASGPDPLVNNLRVIRDDLEQFGTTLQDWLARKMDDGRLALEDMAWLEGLVDDLHDAIATSQMLLDEERGSPKED